MTKRSEAGRFKGVFPPMITPLSGRDELDVKGLQRLVEHILGGGAHGLFILGTTGEAPSLSHERRQEVIRRVCDQVGDRVPVLVGITDTSFLESVNMAALAHRAGAAAVVLAPPYYFPAGQPELLEYIRHLAPELALPLFLYNMPSHTKLVFEPDTVAAAADIPGIVGLKDSSGNMLYFHQLQALLKKRPDFALLIGSEQLMGEAILLGAHGAVCGGANLYPRLFVSLYEAASTGDVRRVMSLHASVMQISNTIYSVGRYGSSYLKGIKCALSCMGICDDFMAEPFHRFRDAERRVIRRHLKALSAVR